MSKRMSAKRREQMETAFDKQVATMRRNEAAKPYPTPWVWNTYQRVNGNKHPITRAPINESGFYIVCPPGFDIAYLPITSSVNGEIQGANVRKIVKAVNSHDALLDAAIKAANFFRKWSLELTQEFGEVEHTRIYELLNAAIEQAQPTKN